MMRQGLPVDREHGPHNRLDAALGAVALVAGAVAIGLVVFTGRHNGSRFLLALFGVWVALPFLAIGRGQRTMSQYGSTMRVVLRCMGLVVILISIVVYCAAAVSPPRKAAAPFVIVPAVSLCVILLLGRFGREPHP